MDEEELIKVEDGLNFLLAKFSKKPNCEHKLAAIKDAKSAIRRVILSVAIKGNLKNIVPYFDPEKGLGWKIIDAYNEVLYYYSI